MACSTYTDVSDHKQEDIEKALKRILGRDNPRVLALVDLFQGQGCTSGEDLKFFDREELELLGLEKPEALRITAFVMENFPEEYGEIKQRTAEKRRTRTELEIVEARARGVREMNRLEEEGRRIAAQSKKRRETMEEISRLADERLELSKSSLRDCLKGKDRVNSIKKFLNRKKKSEEVTERIDAKYKELSENEVSLESIM